MMNKFIDGFSFAVMCFAIIFFVGVLLNMLFNSDKTYENITEQQYRNDSLQYLEDIRNAIEEQNYLLGLGHD